MTILTPKQRFLNDYYTLPEQARTELVVNFEIHPMTLMVIKNEIEQDTQLGRDWLWRLGYRS